MSSVLWGIIILNLLGFCVDLTWNPGLGRPGYFEYRIDLLNGFPYWLFATLTFLAINGIASIYFAGVRFRVTVDERGYDGGFLMPHMRFFGVNLVLIPLFLILFIMIRAVRP